MQLDFNLALRSLMVFVLVIFTILLLHKGRKQYSNILLAIYFISQFIGISDGFQYYAKNASEGVSFIAYPIVFTWAPFFFFYIISLLDNEFRIKWKHAVHFLPFLVVLIYTTITFYSKDYTIRLTLTKTHFIQYDLYHKFSFVFNIQIIGYNIWALIKYHMYQKSLKEEYSTINHSANNWLKTSLFGFLIACFIVQLGIHSRRLGFATKIDWYFAGNFAFLLFFTTLFYKAIVSPNIFARGVVREKYKQSSLETTEAINILAGLEQIMETHKPFTDSQLSLKSLSQLSGVSERVLSQTINEHRHQNFFDFVNSYRVKYSMELLKDKANNRRTMLDILFEAGFNSKSTFNTAFKKHTGLTPTEYKNKNVLA